MSSLQILEGLRPNQLIVGVSKTSFQYECYEVSRAFFARPHHIHLVLPLIAEADLVFGAQIEHELYPYNTPDNDGFHTRMVVWQSMTWGIISVPRKDEPVIQAHCKHHHCYLDRGAYTAKMPDNQSELFPFRGDNFRAVRMIHGLIAAVT